MNEQQKHQTLHLKPKAEVIAKLRAHHDRIRVQQQETDPIDPPVEATLEVGHLTQEGIYIGRLKGEDGVEKDWFAAPDDAKDSEGNRLSLNFNEAAKYAKKSTALGHNDWIMPTGQYDHDGKPDVLNAMFRNKNTGAFKGTFAETSSEAVRYHRAGWYWASSADSFGDDYAKARHFSDGFQTSPRKESVQSVRLVRILTI